MSAMETRQVESSNRQEEFKSIGDAEESLQFDLRKKRDLKLAEKVLGNHKVTIFADANEVYYDTTYEDGLR